MVNDGAELGVGVDAETDDAYHDVVVGLGVERLHGEMKSVGDTVYKINEQVAAVDAPDPQRDGIKSIIRLEIHRHHIVTVR